MVTDFTKYSESQNVSVKKFTATQFFSSNQFEAKFFISRKVNFTKLLRQNCDSNFNTSPQQCGKTRNSLPCKFLSSKQFRVKFFNLTKILRQNRGSKIPYWRKMQFYYTQNHKLFSTLFNNFHTIIIFVFTKISGWKKRNAKHAWQSFV